MTEAWRQWPWWMRLHARLMLRRERRETLRQAAARALEGAWTR